MRTFYVTQWAPNNGAPQSRAFDTEQEAENFAAHLRSGEATKSLRVVVFAMGAPS